MPALELVPLDLIEPTPYYIKRGAPRRCLSTSSCLALLSYPRIEIPDPLAGSRCSFFVGRWRLAQAEACSRAGKRQVYREENNVVRYSACSARLIACLLCRNVRRGPNAPTKTRVNFKKRNLAVLIAHWVHAKISINMQYRKKEKWRTIISIVIVNYRQSLPRGNRSCRRKESKAILAAGCQCKYLA